MKDIVIQIHKLLIKNKKSISVAESCTGGMLSSLLTQKSGSSRYFILGVVAYNNRAKVSLLNIAESLISKEGAVSRRMAKKMAQEIRIMGKTDFGLGITGIAGPTGGTPQKPIGTVFIAIDSEKKKLCRRFIFRGSRLVIRKIAALKTLELLKALMTNVKIQSTK